VPDPGWKRLFEEPIPLPSGGELFTLEDAARYIQGLPKSEQKLDAWQNAVEALLLVVQGNGPTMFAAIAMTQAINGEGPEPPPRKKAKSYKVIP
jgi:hypothetical protein